VQAAVTEFESNLLELRLDEQLQAWLHLNSFAFPFGVICTIPILRSCLTNRGAQMSWSSLMLSDSPRRSVLNSGVQGIPPMENGLVKDRLNRAMYVVIEPCCVMCSCISTRSFYRAS